MTESSATAARVGKIALALFAIALLVRLVHVLQIRAAPFFALLMGDSRSYDEWARRIAGGDWVGREVFYQAPLYPYLLGVLYAVVGRSLLAVRIVQAVIGSASCVLLFLAGRRLFSDRAGIAAGLLLALWAPAIFFDGLIQKSVIDVFLVSLILWLMSLDLTAQSAEQESSRRFNPFAIGLALGALALTRENALVFVVVIAAWMIARPGRWRRLGWLAAGLALVLVPVAARNAAVGGGFFITTSQFGPNFYIGNNPRADGTYASLRFGRGAPEYERQDATQIAERTLGRRLSPAEVSSYWTDRAMTFITSRPGPWLRLAARKIFLLWNATEMVDTESQETHAEWSWPLRVLGPLMHFGLLVPLALVGVIVSWRDRSRLWVLLALIAAYAASVVVFYVFARYRYPLVPLLMLFAAAGAVGLPALVRSNDWTSARGMAIAAVVVAALGFTNWPVMPRDWLRAVSENNIGLALLASNRPIDAEAALRRATGLRPDYAPALNNLGVVLAAQSRIDEAIAAYQAAASVVPDDPDPSYNAGNALLRENRFQEAIPYFRRAIERDQGLPDAHNNLAMALASTGQRDEAMREYRTAIGLDPNVPQPRRNLADLLARSGRLQEALDEMRRALQLAPEDGTLHYDLGSLWLDTEQLESAAGEFREAIRLAPRFFPAHNNLGIVLASQEKLDEAIAMFRTALTLATTEREKEDAQRNLETATAALRSRPKVRP